MEEIRNIIREILEEIVSDSYVLFKDGKPDLEKIAKMGELDSWIGRMQHFPSTPLDMGGIQVSHKYKLPYGMNENSIGAYASAVSELEKQGKISEEEFWNSIDHIYEEIKKLNPELNDINDKGESYTALYGVVSRFNPDDIEGFILYGGYNKMKPNHKHLLKRTLNKYGLGEDDIAGYLPSMKTLFKMREKWQQN